MRISSHAQSCEETGEQRWHSVTRNKPSIKKIQIKFTDNLK